MLEGSHALLCLALGWWRQTMPILLLFSLPFSLDSGREGARTAESVVLWFRRMAEWFFGQLALLGTLIDLFGGLFLLGLVCHFLLSLLACLGLLNCLLWLVLQSITMWKAIGCDSLSESFLWSSQAVDPRGKFGFPRDLAHWFDYHFIRNDLRTLHLPYLSFILDLNLLPHHRFLLPLVLFLLILILPSFLQRRHLNMRDHEPIIIGISEIYGIIIGISNLG